MTPKSAAHDRTAVLHMIELQRGDALSGLNENLYLAARAVLSNWEKGDLANAVQGQARRPHPAGPHRLGDQRQEGVEPHTEAFRAIVKSCPFHRQAKFSQILENRACQR